MTAGIHNLEKRLSGGAANTDPSASLGGAKSSEVILSQEVTIITPISGVTLVEGRGNSNFSANPSSGNLSFVNASISLRWQPPGFTVGPAIDVSVDGRYTLTGPVGGSGEDDLLIVDVVAASLPLADTNSNVDILTPPNSLFDDIGAVEAFIGATNYRCYYVENNSGADTLFGVKVYIGQQPAPGQDVLALGLDPAGINGTATTIGDEGTAPGGVAFSTPTSYASGLLIGDLTPGDFAAIWIRRTIPAASTFPAPVDTSRTLHGMFF